MSAPVADDAYAQARPLWGEVDLGAIAANLELVRARVGRDVRVLAPIKADAYGHGAVPVARHLAALGVDGLATANLDDALAVRRAGIETPILMYAASLPGGLRLLLEHRLTPTVCDAAGLAEVARLAVGRDAPVRVHLKVDAGLGRLGVRLDAARALARAIDAAAGVELEGVYTHIPFGAPDGAGWSARRLEAFAAVVREIEADRGAPVRFAQGAASSVIAAGLPDGLNTIAPGHLVFGLSPIAGLDVAALGFRPALRAVRARLIHVGERRRGDDLAAAGPGGLAADGRVGIVLFGMDNGYRPAASPGAATMLCRGRRCTVVSVSAEYATIDLAAVPDADVGDLVTIVGADGDDAIGTHDVAASLGAPSAAYWLCALRNVPLRYA